MWEKAGELVFEVSGHVGPNEWESSVYSKLTVGVTVVVRGQGFLKQNHQSFCCLKLCIVEVSGMPPGAHTIWGKCSIVVIIEQ